MTSLDLKDALNRVLNAIADGEADLAIKRANGYTNADDVTRMRETLEETLEAWYKEFVQ